MSQHDRYISPFSTRYSSDEMQYIFSDDNKFRTWRRLWVALARAEMKQGLTNITPEMVEELEAHVDDINYDVAIAREKLVRHDVMSHVYAYGQQCPKAAGIIHLGATSCYVGDNTDIIVMRQGLELIRKKLIGVLAKLARFAEEYKDMPCMAYTHCQPAQPTTVGKRATLWANELVMDLQEIDHRLAVLQLRGVKGTTGTQASFMELFKGDADKIRAVDASIAEEMGFDPEAVIPVSGQTYSRKVDSFILNALAGIAQSCMKFATDLRLLANFKEMEEPFEKNQIGSSAMPYKRNPMRCERICALSRYLMVDVLNPSFTTGTQWFERTLDDSANKRISVAEGFLAADPTLEIDPNTGHIVKDKPPENRCLIPTDMMDEYGIRLGDWIWLEAITYPYTNSNDTQIIQVAFRVVGAFVQTGRANNIYANLDMPKYFLDLSMASVYEWSTQDLPGGTILTRGGICMRQAYSGATFSIPSCTDLTSVKQALHDMGLSEVGRISSIRNFVIINDAAYLTTERAAAQRLWYMQHLFPVVYAIALGLAYLLAFLQVQSRRRELRTMRSVGADRKTAYGSLFLEQLMLAALGAVLGAGLCLALGWGSRLGLGLTAAFAVLWLLGAHGALCRANSRHILKNRREVE